MNEALFTKMVEGKRYDYISPGQARGALATILHSRAALGEHDLFVELGKALSSDGVLTGYLYRWTERQGTDYAVDQPASVAFDLYLIRVLDGAILWKASYDKSQRSLSENVLDYKAFVRSKGKWMTAENLAEIGLNDLIDRFPPPEASEGRRD